MLYEVITTDARHVAADQFIDFIGTGMGFQFFEFRQNNPALARHPQILFLEKSLHDVSLSFPDAIIREHINWGCSAFFDGFQYTFFRPAVIVV